MTQTVPTNPNSSSLVTMYTEDHEAQQNNSTPDGEALNSHTAKPGITLSDNAKKNLKIIAGIFAGLAALTIIVAGVQYGVHGGWHHALDVMHNWAASGSILPNLAWVGIGASFIMGGLTAYIGPKGISAIKDAITAFKATKTKPPTVSQVLKGDGQGNDLYNDNQE